jgi:hypothetical protein
MANNRWRRMRIRLGHFLVALAKVCTHIGNYLLAVARPQAVKKHVYERSIATEAADIFYTKDRREVREARERLMLRRLMHRIVREHVRDARKPEFEVSRAYAVFDEGSNFSTRHHAVKDPRRLLAEMLAALRETEAVAVVAAATARLPRDLAFDDYAKTQAAVANGAALWPTVLDQLHASDDDLRECLIVYGWSVRGGRVRVAYERQYDDDGTVTLVPAPEVITFIEQSHELILVAGAARKEQEKGPY